MSLQPWSAGGQGRSGAAPYVKRLLLETGAYGLLRRIAPSQRLAILRYHAVYRPDACPYADAQICVSPGAFEAHVQYLARHYTVVPLPDAVARLRASAPLPLNAVAITFDDGYADNLAAARILAAHGASATFYITAGCLAGEQPFWPAELRHLVRSIPESVVSLSVAGEPLVIDLGSDATRRAAVRQLTKLVKSHPIPVREALREQLRARARGGEPTRVMLTWDEVREMSALGMTIGSHTMTHPNLPNAGLADARLEIERSKAALEGELGIPVTMFSYPNGGAERYMTRDIARLVQDAGFAAATTSRNAFAGPDSDLFALERVQVAEPLEGLVFALEVERFVRKPKRRPGEMDS